jgi:hypothetical protein
LHITKCHYLSASSRVRYLYRESATESLSCLSLWAHLCLNLNFIQISSRHHLDYNEDKSAHKLVQSVYIGFKKHSYVTVSSNENTKIRRKINTTKGIKFILFLKTTNWSKNMSEYFFFMLCPLHVSTPLCHLQRVTKTCISLSYVTS